MIRRSLTTWLSRGLLSLVALVALVALLPACAQAATSVNARAYGMVGDNVTDNSAALLRACRAESPRAFLW